jgi:hypothetical protein
MNTNKENKEKRVVKEKDKMQKKSLQTHIRHSERDKARDVEMKNGRQ